MPTQNCNVIKWIEDVERYLRPEKTVWILDPQVDAPRLSEQLVKDGAFVALNPQEFPHCYWTRSDRDDVARVEDRTFICSRSQHDSGPTNNWAEPEEMYRRLRSLMEGCMAGRTLYVVPYLMGPAGSPFSKVGFELTDSPYVVVNMCIMARVGNVALQQLSVNDTNFVRGIHSVGTLNPNDRYICHFPEDLTIISFNSNYGGNALQGKKCFALRIASTIARREGWLAEHMLIVGITNPHGEKTYLCAAFPSACGKTNLAMLVPPPAYQRAGWKVETVGDDIAWLRVGSDGRLRAINPEAGFFGVAPGTSDKTNPNAMATIRSNTIFTNTALDLDRMTPWWEGMGAPPVRALDWLGNQWSPNTTVGGAAPSKAAHPNSRFTAPARQCPCIDPAWENPEGVPISAIIFGGRRATTAPLVYQARSWQHGTFLGLTMASETTAAATGSLGRLRRDPMAMLPFIGYHAADYVRHWLELGRGKTQMPAVFHVNWFRAENGQFLWPGFGENMRVLEWIINRVHGRVGAQESQLGFQPNAGDVSLVDTNLSQDTLTKLLAVLPDEWRDEIESQKAFFESLGKTLPEEMWSEHHTLRKQLGI